MNLPSRIESLRTRHASLDSRIFDEDRRPAPDQGTLSRLKREKLRVKEELERLRQRN
ncbi:YdcH family protein [Lichenicola sp.]|uniref:YdcH family protein n=1 Tax=Lichenicola sp. TaxID=2804529 RepID=UPI003B003877